MNKYFVFILIVSAFTVSAIDTPYTPQVITTRGDTSALVNFFNYEQSNIFNAKLDKGTALRLDRDSVFVDEQSIGSFNLIVGDNGLERGVYFDRLKIYRDETLVQDIPVIIGLESDNSVRAYDVLIDYNPTTDLSTVDGEKILAPNIKIFKLDYDNPTFNSAALIFSIYSINGDLLLQSEEVVSISKQASFRHFFNIGNTDLREVLIVVSIKKGDSVGIALRQVSLVEDILLSPPPKDSYLNWLYLSIFIFLMSTIILISYLWHDRSNKQLTQFKESIYLIKKNSFGNELRSIRKLEAQKDVLKRARESQYISDSSFNKTIREIDELKENLRKRL